MNDGLLRALLCSACLTFGKIELYLNFYCQLDRAVIVFVLNSIQFTPTQLPCRHAPEHFTLIVLGITGLSTGACACLFYHVG